MRCPPLPPPFLGPWNYRHPVRSSVTSQITFVRWFWFVEYLSGKKQQAEVLFKDQRLRGVKRWRGKAVTLAGGSVIASSRKRGSREVSFSETRFSSVYRSLASLPTGGGGGTLLPASRGLRALRSTCSQFLGNSIRSSYSVSLKSLAS